MSSSENAAKVRAHIDSGRTGDCLRGGNESGV
jgi:hypothetical protein